MNCGKSFERKGKERAAKDKEKRKAGGKGTGLKTRHYKERAKTNLPSGATVPRSEDRAAKRARYIVPLRKEVRAYRGDPRRVKGRRDNGKNKERGRTALRLRSG